MNPRFLTVLPIALILLGIFVCKIPNNPTLKQCVFIEEQGCDCPDKYIATFTKENIVENHPDYWIISTKERIGQYIFYMKKCGHFNFPSKPEEIYDYRHNFVFF